MRSELYKKINQSLIFFLMTMTVFTLPLSISLRSIFLSLATLTLFFHPDCFSYLRECFKESWCKALLLFFFMMVASSFVGTADWHTQLEFINKYSKLLYIPLFALAFQNKDLANMAIRAFLLAMLLTVICSILFLLGLKLPHVEFADSIFHNHITTSYFMAIAAFIAAHYAVKKRGLARFGYVCLSFIFSADTFFINSGRTGYVVYFILLGLFIYSFCSLKKLAVYFLCALPLFGLALSTSKVLNTSVKNALHEIHEYQAGSKISSIGFRMQFHQYAKQLFYQHPLFGLGTAGFTTAFAKDQPIPTWGPTLLDPHNQYWLIAAEQGIIGITVLGIFFFSLLRAVPKIQEDSFLYLGILITFIVANHFDSFLLLSSTGYFFVLFVGLFLSNTVRVKEISTQKPLNLAEAEVC